MTFDQFLSVTSQFSLYAWLIAAVASFMLLQYTRTNGWIMVMLGSVLMVMRQAWKFMPAYKGGQESDAFLNGYALRHLFGSAGMTFLIIGFIMLIVSYYVIKTRMEG